MSLKKDITYCNNCGNELKKESIYCEKCGNKISNNIEVTVDESSNEDTLKVTYEPRKEDYSVLKAKKEKNSNDYLVPFITSLITIFICMILMFIYCNFFFEKGKNTTKVEKDVTVTDEGIADAVDKIYDAVVVVENYVKGSLYSTGTGFVYKKENDKAYILTNYHVIDSSSEVYVIFTDNTKIKVNIVGGDAYSDIAVLEVDASKIKEVATIGSSEELRVGDTTFAVGAPLDATTYSWTVTRGILSGKNRLVEISSASSSSVMEVLQTDTAINSGNSGGPLCNSNGEVIGITNMKIASSSVEGMGFAIPIEVAISYADKYIDGEDITRPYLGISMYDVTNRYDSTSKGIYIESVESGSPADKAGLQKGDVIIEINNVKVESSAYLKYELYKHSPGDEITIKYNRDGKEYTTKVKLGSNTNKN